MVGGGEGVGDELRIYFTFRICEVPSVVKSKALCTKEVDRSGRNQGSSKCGSR